MKKENFALIAETFFDNAEIVAFCQKEMAKLDKRVEAKKAATAENESLTAQILTTLDGTRGTAAEVAEVLGISNQKASYLMRTMYANGQLTRETDGRRYLYRVA